MLNAHLAFGAKPRQPVDQIADFHRGPLQRAPPGLRKLRNATCVIPPTTPAVMHSLGSPQAHFVSRLRLGSGSRIPRGLFDDGVIEIKADKENRFVSAFPAGAFYWFGNA